MKSDLPLVVVGEISLTTPNLRRVVDLVVTFNCDTDM